jgi:DNA-directed RNA polymerase subunit M/transcription elongation factor TFIIS
MMAESFECPKCGAPMHYNSQEQGYAETMACPYCGESVVIPADMRKAPEPQPNNSGLNQVDMNNLIDLEREALSTYNPSAYQAPIAQVKKAAGWSATGCVVTSLVGTAVAGIIIFIVFISLGASFMSIFTPSSTSRPAILPVFEPSLVPRPSDMPATLEPTDSSTPTPEVNTTATAQAQSEATRTVQNALAEKQRNWPVVLQEKFVNNKLNWNTGTDNTDLAIEDYRISGSKYTWKFTSKKPMASFSYPDMPVQKDVFISVDLQMTSSNQNSDDQAGIIFHHTAKDQSFYFFSINPNGAYSLSMYDGSGWNDLINTSDTDQLKPNQVNHLAVSMQGSQILLIINNSVVNSFEDTQLTSGIAGLGLNLSAPGEDATVIFTNFYVRAPKN